MTPADWARLKEVFLSALEKPQSEREAFLSGASTDPGLRDEVRKLLAAHARGGLESPLSAVLPAAPPAVIGRYRILRLLGEGGMGAVYEAEQDQPRRTVALKVIRPGLAGPELLRRFEHESQALGRLHHPGIAQIYEAGAAEGAFGPQPYFAMEFIQGESLLRYAESRQLNARQRLELMVKICDAVHHAHQRGIIHRDLKPGNILVDETGQPKILDFGVARFADSDAPATRQTDAGQLVGTLAYMSPEQVLADPLELDTRSDVYALGVILFELLAGRMPYQISGPAPKAIQTILEEEPARLSSVSRAYRGDIETIAAKALQKDKARRYGSAAELGADILRYLWDEPIVARPATPAYQLRKFARRHSALVAGTAAAAVMLMAGVVASTWEAARARRAEQEALRQRNQASVAQQAAQSERDRSASERNRAVAAEAQAVAERNRALAEKTRADAESATAKAINEFLSKDLLARASASVQAGPGVKPDPDLKVRTALDRAAAAIAGKFDRQPQVEASIRQTVSDTYRDLGLYAEAQRQAERALDLKRRTLGENHRDTLDTMQSLAVLYRLQGDHASAERLFTRLLEIRRRVLGEWDPDTLKTGESLALLYQEGGKYSQAQPLYTNVLEGRRRTLGWEHLGTVSSMNDLAGAYERQRKYADAEPLLRQVLEVRRRVLGKDHPDTIGSLHNLARLYQEQGNYGRAEPLFLEVIASSRRVLGEEHPRTLNNTHNLAILYAQQGRLADAEPLFSKILEVQRRVLGEEHGDTLRTMHDVAKLYLLQGRDASAEPLLTKGLELSRRVLGEEHPWTLNNMVDLGILYRMQGRYADAEPLYTKLVEVRRRVRGEEHPDTLSSMRNLAVLYRYEGRYAEAEPLLIKVLETRRRVLGQQHPATWDALASLGELRLAQERYADAESLLREALKSDDKTWEHYSRRSLLGVGLMAQSKYDEAEPLLISGYRGLLERRSTIDYPSRDALRRAGDGVVRLYVEWGKPEKASEWREKLQADGFGATKKP